MSLAPLEWIKIWRAERKEQRRLAKFDQAQAWARDLPLQTAFERIYAEAKWGEAPGGGAFWSGNGSREEFSATYENYVVTLIDKHPDIASIVDVGCGDFQVSGRILQRLARPVDYHGVDVVRPLIDLHQATNAAAHIRFSVCNAVEDEMPKGDLGLIRQILQHLSNAQTATILRKAAESFKAVIIVESLPREMRAPNLDIGHGITTRIALGSGNYIDLPPYNLPVAEHFDVEHSTNEIIRTSLVWFNQPR